MEPKKVVLVIGNGFDLDLGFKTKYSDFAKSTEWKKMFAKEAGRSQHYSLLKYLNDRKDIDNWFDIEQALFEYAHIKTKDVWIHNLETDKREFLIICDTFRQYLENHIYSCGHSFSDSFSAKILRCFQRNSELRKIYTFNYTPLDLIVSNLGLLHPLEVVHIHGSTKEHNMILGFETNTNSSIIQGYDFLLKTNQASYHHTQMQYDMMDADEVVVFGHSLNMIDSVLFEDYLQNLTQPICKERRLTIITSDYISQQLILYNIRQMQVSVPKLFSYARLEFIWTSKMTKIMKEGAERLLKRIEI